MKRKLPKEWALMLADLHNKVMEVQDTFDTIKSDLYSGETNEDVEEFLKGFDLDQLTEEVESICDRLDDLEADTSELDCEYNNYDSPISTIEDKEDSDIVFEEKKYIITFTSYIRYVDVFGEDEELEFDEEENFFADTEEEAEAIADEDRLGLVGQWVEVRINDKLYREYEVEGSY